MAAIKVKKLWTVFITAFFAVLASLGLTTPAAAAGSAVPQPVDQPADQPAPAPAAYHGSAEPAGRRRVAEAAPVLAVPRQLPRGRSLPPTIKQRIRAEAHGSSPSVRHLPADSPLDVSADALAESLTGAGAKSGAADRAGTASTADRAGTAAVVTA